MEQKRVDYGIFTWIPITYFLIVRFVIAVCEGSLTENAFTFSAVIGLLITPLVIFLLNRLFALIDKKRKKEVILPRWIDLFFVYLIGFGGAVACLSYSTRAYWIAVPVLMIFASIIMLIKAFVATRPEPKE